MRAEKVMKHESDSDTNHSWNPQKNLKEHRKHTGGTKNQETIESVHTIALLSSARIQRTALES